MFEMIPGDRIADLIRRAHKDLDLRIRIFHCPEKIIGELGLDERERRAILTGDLSQVDLDDETLEAGRILFNDLPGLPEGVSQEAAAYLAVRSDRIDELCT